MLHAVTSKKLLVIVGATAVGKTDISLQLATHFNCSILSADSRQCYRELGVATAKPEKQALDQIPHYFVNSHSIKNPVTAAGFEIYALNILNELYQGNHRCIMLGGSGLYIKAVLEGMDEIPSISPSVRENLMTRLRQDGLEKLVDELRNLDPRSSQAIDCQNPQRVVRALEVCLGTGKPFSSFRTGKRRPRPFEIIKIGLHRDRPVLYQRINQRMDSMITEGLFEEAAELFDFRENKALQTVGYQEAFGYLEGRYDKTEAVRLLKRNSRRYAKRQLTWFGRDNSIKWFDADDQEQIFEYLEQIF